MNKKGFTLVELVAVITILGMLLVVTIPATGRLIASNDKRMYDEYYTLVAGAVNKYAKGEYFNLGGVSNSGCVELNDLDTLIELGLIKSFNTNDENIECYLPSELETYTKVSQSALSNLQDGKGPSSFYDIRITNNKGKINIVHSLVCVRDNKTIVYKRLVEKDGSECKKYEQQNANILANALLSETSSLVDGENGVKFYTGANYYVKYSGKLWQVVSINSNGTIKLLSDDIVSAYTYFPDASEDTAVISYRDSNIQKFNDNKFKNTLSNVTIYLEDSTWNYNNVANGDNPPASDANKEVSSVIGLLNLYEFNKIKDRFASELETPWFLISQKDNNKVWVANKNTTQEKKGDTFGGIRPSIVLRANVTYLEGGVGSKTNPYVLIGEQTGLAGEKLSSRFAGEYVTFDNKTYRIIETSEDGTKMLSTEYAMEGIFDDINAYIFGAGAKIANYMETNYFTPMTDKTLVVSHEYCAELFDKKTSYITSCGTDYIRTGNYSIPMIGDMYTTFTSAPNIKYWSLSPAEAEKDEEFNTVVDPKVNIITNNNVLPSAITETAKYYPVIVISPGAKITGGDGLLNPYTIQ